LVIAFATKNNIVTRTGINGVITRVAIEPVSSIAAKDEIITLTA
jgi:hypothetical protein